MCVVCRRVGDFMYVDPSVLNATAGSSKEESEDEDEASEESEKEETDNEVGGGDIGVASGWCRAGPGCSGPCWCCITRCLCSKQLACC